MSSRPSYRVEEVCRAMVHEEERNSEQAALPPSHAQDEIVAYEVVGDLQIRPFKNATSRRLLSAACAFRPSRPGIPSEGGHPFQLKPARDSDDLGHVWALALVSALSSVHSTGSASSF